MPFKILRLLALVGLAVIGGAGSARAHEPYLQVTANADGTFTAEAGFSDASDVAGLKLFVRDRATGAMVSEQALPTGGKLTLAIPAVPYRVTFDGGPGHKISKIGPERLVAVTAAESGLPVEPVSTKKVRAVQPGVVSQAPLLPAGAGDEKGADFSTTLTVVTLVFLLAVVSFALGFFAASRRATQR